ATRVASGLNSYTVILHGNADGVARAGYLYGNVAGVGMPGHVMEGLLDYAIDRLFGGWGQPSYLAGNNDPCLDPGIPGQILGLFADGGYQSQFLQYQRRQFADNASDAFDSPINHLYGFANLGLDVTGGDAGFEHAQVESDDHERLPGFIVKLAANPLAFLFLDPKEVA